MIINNPTPLKGIVLVGYAKAYADAGVVTAAHKCGYGDNVRWFGKALRSTCADIGVESKELLNLVTEHQQIINQQESKPTAKLVVGWH
ncbi:hypothetical protein [Leptolyngbya ectocarpi]|uniref:hypothetical protein n=1 Tax=Leptolyngbya ectocarpi TaxID=1202 RepID=UPI001D1507E6|nr:hypothetical protein [Leptolyngbya ectocarpi]